VVIQNLLIALDFSETSDAALAYARELARQFGARLHVLHVRENDFLRPTALDPSDLDTAAWRQLTHRLTEEDRRLRHALPVVRKSDNPANEIVQYAKSEQVDLIVMGTHGRRGVAHLLLGSVAEQVIRSAPCPVVTVRHSRRGLAQHESAGALPVAARPRSVCST
jgi:nucleotide-binding universal stress UspA family protein